jgi:NDP-sugar pyrophosphorylase family protein
MSKRSLVILAAGMGSRFGGLKQATPVGPSGEVIADYSVYDAIKNGFERVVFIIREEHTDIFKEITDKFKDKIEVCFAYQKLDAIPNDVVIPEGRTKMWGTTHALLAAKDFIDGPFVMLNADDFYGYDTFRQAKLFFDNKEYEDYYATVGYPFKTVSSKNGAVKRGIISISDGVVKDIIEAEIELTDKGNLAHPLDGSDAYYIEDDQPVSMNFLCFKPSIFNYLERDFNKFIYGPLNEKCECLIPDTLKGCINNNEITVKNFTTSAKWIGMTYKEDLVVVQDTIKEFIKEGIYPSNLWG